MIVEQQIMEESEPERTSADPSSAELKWTPRFKIGVVLLVSNIPMGLIGFALTGIMAATTGNKAFWAMIGVIIYGLSWAMLGLGVLLAGPQGVGYVKALRRKWLGRGQQTQNGEHPTPKE